VTLSDGAYVRRALRLALRGWGQTAPNPLVGAVVVRDGVIVGEGHHARYGDEHAEVAGLRAAGERAAGATLYVSLEPCTHIGKTPACTDAIIAARVARVVVATEDPNPEARGGIARLEAAGIATTVGVERGAGRELNAPFFHALASDRPWVTLKLALSLDGAVAGAAREKGWITNARSRARVHWLRAGSDAIAVGIGTVLADDPALTVRGRGPKPRVPPKRVVFDRTARLPLTSQLVRSVHDVPVIVVTESPDPERARSLAEAGVEVMTTTGLGDALRQLRQREIRSILFESGPRLTGALLAAAVVDRLIIFQAPVILGAGAIGAFTSVPTQTVRTAVPWRVVERRTLGDDVMTTYALE
jgi:diaminohydroxyphosphoribosylaminopyrimidine deaminase / 5-amino-6-(5-phosphoribosylamino)uracil reductase